MTNVMEGQVSLFDLDTWCGKMSQGPSVQETPKERTSKPSSKKSSKSSGGKSPVFLSLKTDGPMPDASAEWVTAESPFPSLGDYTMLSFGAQPSTLMEECGFQELPNGVSVSRLSQILTDSPHPKYSLSAKACMGILNRAERRGKELPEVLRTALEKQAGL